MDDGIVDKRIMDNRIVNETIVDESLLNFPNDFHVSITKPLTTCDDVSPSHRHDVMRYRWSGII